MRRILGLAVLLALASCITESDDWEDDVGQSQLALSSSEPGYVTTSNAYALANRCAVDPIGDVNSGFTVDPSYIMAYRSGKSTACAGSVSAPYIVGSPSDYHRQSIQRIRRNTQNYLFVTQSVPPPSETSWYPGFEVIEVGGAGHGTGFLDLGSAGVTPTSYSLCGDHIVKYQEYSSTVRRHAGGMQVNGSYVVVPFEDNQNYSVAASFRTFDVSDPPNSFSGPTVLRQQGNTAHGGAAALTRTNDSKFLAMVFGQDSSDVEVFVSSGTTMPTSPTDWDSKISTAAFGSSENDYQNVQFITECDVDTSGRLFAVATHKNSSGEDWVDLYKVTLNTTTYAPTFTKVASRKMTCSSANTGTRYCDFDAGAGVFVDANGILILYGVEHYNDHYPGDDTAVKVREFPIP